MQFTSHRITRRELLRKAVLGGTGIVAASVAASCATPTPQIVKETVVVKETQIVEKVVEKAITPAPAQAVEISFWVPAFKRYGKDNLTAGAPVDEWYNDALERYKAKAPLTKVKMEVMPWDQWGPKVTTAFASGDLPNVIYASYSADRVLAGILEQLDDYYTKEDLDNLLPGVRDGLVIFGHRYSFPAFLNPNMSAFNVTGLEKFGGIDIVKAVGEVRDGLTFDMMKEYGQQFSDGKTRWFYGIGTDHTGVAYWNFGNWLTGWGMRMWSEDEERWIVADQPEAVEAFQWYVDAQNTWKILVPNLPKYSDIDNFFWQSKIAMRNQWMALQAKLEVAQKAGQADKDFKFILVGHPHKKDVAPFASGTVAAPGSNFQVCRTPDRTKRDAAALFAKWLAMDDSNAAGWLVEGLFPVTYSGAKAVADHPFMQDQNRKWVLEVYMDPKKYPPHGYGEGEFFYPVKNARSAKIFNELKPSDYFIQMFQSLLLGERTPEQMLKEMSARINGAISGKA